MLSSGVLFLLQSSVYALTFVFCFEYIQQHDMIFIIMDGSYDLGLSDYSDVGSTIILDTELALV